MFKIKDIMQNNKDMTKTKSMKTNHKMDLNKMPSLKYLLMPSY